MNREPNAMNYVAIANSSPLSASITFHCGTSTPIIVFKSNGEVVWRGKVVEGDEEFKAAMMGLYNALRNMTGG